MAIKGKKKSQKRGSQGVRRPAAAPRPSPTPRRRTPWYRTREGMMVSGVFLLVFLGLIIWAVASAQERAREEETARRSLDQYTTQVRAALEGAIEPVTEMNLVATTPSGGELDDLAENSDRWVNSVREAQAQVVQIFPERPVESVNQLFNEALSLYISSAQTFALVPQADGELREELFSRAADQRDTASALWSSAIGVLDQFRRDRGMGPSGLRAPTPPVPEPQPGAEPPEIEVPTDPEGGTEIEIPVDPEAPEGEGEPGAGQDDGTGEGEAENDDGGE